MNIKYCDYEDKFYYEITIEELKQKITNLNKDLNSAMFVVLDDIKDNTYYFSEICAYDY